MNKKILTLLSLFAIFVFAETRASDTTEETASSPTAKPSDKTRCELTPEEATTLKFRIIAAATGEDLAAELERFRALLSKAKNPAHDEWDALIVAGNHEATRVRVLEALTKMETRDPRSVTASTDETRVGGASVEETRVSVGSGEGGAGGYTADDSEDVTTSMLESMMREETTVAVGGED